MKQKNHHYITECYQRGFTDTKGHVWVLTRDGRIYNTKPVNTFKQSYFYSIKFLTGNDSLIVENTLAKMEGDFIGVVLNVIEGKKPLTPIDKGCLAIFIAGMFTRTKVQREHFKNQTQNLISRMEEIKEAVMKNPNQKDLMTMERGDEPSVSLDELKQGMQDFDSEESIRTISLVEDIAPILFDMNWTILEAGEAEEFICSDNPLCLCAPERELEYGRGTFGATAGLGHVDVELTFPLTKKFALFASWNDGKEDGGYLLAPDALVDQINARTSRSCNNVFASNETLLKSGQRDKEDKSEEGTD